MALQAENSVGPSPHVVGSAFAQQYYRVLNQSPEHVHKFYHDESILGRPDSSGLMTYVTTTHTINEQILSTDLRCCLIELENVDTQPSYEGGMLILVTGSITATDTVKHRFTQSFFLAPQENGGYFVLNDMLRYMLEMPSVEANESLANHDTEITQTASFSAEPETTSIKESAALELLSAENILVNDEVTDPCAETTQDNAEVITPSTENISIKEKVTNPSTENISAEEKVTGPSAENISAKRNATNPSANDNAQTKTDVAKKCVEVVTVPADPISEAAPATPASVQKDVSKKSYASIVKDMKDSTLPPPIANPKSKPKPAVKRAENVETSASITAKLTHATHTAPPNDKNVSNEQGYSVFVKNLPFNATVEMVEGEFKKFGAIKPGGIQVKNRQPDQFCFGFVEFESQQSVRAAIEASPIQFGLKQSYVEEKRTTRRVVNGVVTNGYDTGNIRGSRIQPGRGGYHGQGAGFVNNGDYRDGDNFRGHGADFRNNNYRDGDNFRRQGVVFRNNNSYHDGDNFSGQGAGFRNKNYRDGDNFRGRGAGFVSNGNYRDNGNMRNEFRNQDEYSGRGRGPQGNGYHQNGNGYNQNGNGYHQNGNGYHQNGNGYHQNGNGYQQSRPFHNENGNVRSARINGPRQTPVAA